jgi:gluconate 2-dehydrogenase gamma chain
LTWQVLDRVQQHLLPSEPGIPGAQEVNALLYLRFVVQDPKVEADTRAFIPQGAAWLEDMARQLTQRSFLTLDANERERVLRRIASSRVGEHWLSTLLTYLMEALLTDPAYGGNPDGIGWRWLRHTPGYPRPSATTIYPRLVS